MNHDQAYAGLRAQGVDAETAAHFLAWLRLHRGVWRAFESKALALIGVGVRHYGAKAILEAVRYETSVEKKSEFKVNNNFASYLARIFAMKHPAQKKFFSMREVRGLGAARDGAGMRRRIGAETKSSMRTRIENRPKTPSSVSAPAPASQLAFNATNTAVIHWPENPVLGLGGAKQRSHSGERGRSAREYARAHNLAKNQCAEA